MLRFLAFGLVASVFATAPLAAQTLRVDPPHWWVGSSVNRLELLVSSDAELSSVTVSAPGIAVVSDVPAANPRYRYVTVEIQPGAKHGSATVVAEVGRKKIRAEWKLKERRPRAAAPGLSQRDLIYLVTPDRFANGNPWALWWHQGGPDCDRNRIATRRVHQLRHRWHCLCAWA